MSTNPTYPFNTAWGSAFISLAAAATAIYSLIRMRPRDPKTTALSMFFVLTMMIVALIMTSVTSDLVNELGSGIRLRPIPINYSSMGYRSTSTMLTLLCFLSAFILNGWFAYAELAGRNLWALSLFSAAITTDTIGGYMYVYQNISGPAESNVRSIVPWLAYASLAAVIVTLLASIYELRIHWLRYSANVTAH